MAYRNIYKSPSKYKAKKTVVDGITFDSKKESKRYQELKLLEKAGKISNLQTQVKYVLIPAQYLPTGEVYRQGKNKGKPKMKLAEREIAYYADFQYEEDGQTVVEDVKGMRLSDYKLKRKMMLYFHGIQIKEI